jgi:cellulose biosynthesis protein BcsQ
MTAFKMSKVRIPFSNERRRKFARIIALLNNKGGCGKTSSCIALGVYLARAGFNVLFVDCDSQSNLSQRLGVSDDEFQNRSLMEFFHLMDRVDFIEAQKELPIAIQYRYLYKKKGYTGKPGTIAILPGNQYVEAEAALAMQKLSNSKVLDYEQKMISNRFKSALESYLNHFDFIILDTAPALEGSKMCQLALQAADEVICPVDGLEAALGLIRVINWLDLQTSPTFGVTQKPNLTFSMMKYHEDALEELQNMSRGYSIPNAVFSAMKDVLGPYVCDNGIEEAKDRKNKVYQLYGRSNNHDYEVLCEEIITKISHARPNFFEHWNIDAENEFRKKLHDIETASLKSKTPTFKDIVYQERKDFAKEESNVFMGPGYAKGVSYHY